VTGELIAFFVLALFTLGGAILMISLTKVVHMVISLAFTFIGIAGFYVLLHAEFIAFAQVLIYGGAVAIIMLFGIMLTKHNDQDESRRPGFKVFVFVAVAGFFLIVFKAINTLNWIPDESQLYESNTTNLGIQLFAKYVIPFELTSVVLLVALVGAIIMAKRDNEDVSKEGEARD
jgi:NADH-quinone oxidoreductase subunit J